MHCDALTSLPKSLKQLPSLVISGRADLQERDLHQVPFDYSNSVLLDKAKQGLDDQDITQLGEEFPVCLHVQTVLLHHNRFTLLPDKIGLLQSLRELDLSNCPFLKTLPDSIGNLLALQVLRMKACKGLVSLPSSFGCLEALQYLSMVNCQSIEFLPESFGSLKSLHELYLNGCEALRTLPDSFGDLQALHDLNILYCDSLTSLPPELKCIPSLKIAGRGDLQHKHLQSTLFMHRVKSALSMPGDLTNEPEAESEDGWSDAAPVDI